jgi:Ran GTPase-activating protein (RanGAP) involved in mRNA processing and transport
MGPAGARALADCPALRAVDSLDLEGNVLGDGGLAALAASPYPTHLRVLSLRENRITDDGIRALSRSPVMATLRVLDLTGNLITQDSQDRLHEASVAHDWRGLLQLKVDSQLRIRPLGVGPLGGFFRRPQS